MTPRDALIADAAITVLGTGGPRRLTHRAVDGQAGLPEGSTSNRFRTRGALIDAVLRRTLEREMRIWQRLEAEVGDRDIEGLAMALGALIRDLIVLEPELTSARHALLVDAAGNTALRGAIASRRDELEQHGARRLARLGSRSPAAHQRALLALLDGLLLQQSALPESNWDPTLAIRAFLRGCLSAGTQPDVVRPAGQPPM